MVTKIFCGLVAKWWDMWPSHFHRTRLNGRVHCPYSAIWDWFCFAATWQDSTDIATSALKDFGDESEAVVLYILPCLEWDSSNEGCRDPAKFGEVWKSEDPWQSSRDSV